MSKVDLAYLFGFYIGDGYFTYGRTGFDTISPQIAVKLSEILTKISPKQPAVEVYGNPEKFSGVIGRKLFYKKRSAKHSDYVKVRIDSVKFSEQLSENISDFLSKLDDKSEKEIRAFARGFCDAEASVSPDATVQIDMAKENLKTLKLAKKVFGRLGIGSQLKMLAKKCRLIVSGTSKNLDNLIKFRNKVNFYIPEKRRVLEISLKIYGQPRDKRTPDTLSKDVIKVLSSQNKCDIFNLMLKTNSKYTNLRRSLNILKNRKAINKIFNGQKVLVELSS